MALSAQMSIFHERFSPVPRQFYPVHALDTLEPQAEVTPSMLRGEGRERWGGESTSDCTRGLENPAPPETLRSRQCPGGQLCRTC